MNRALSGTLTVSETGRPLRGMRVVAVQVITEGLRPLGDTVSGELGRFLVTYPPIPGPASLSLLVFSPTGRLVYTEPVHRFIDGAELRLAVTVPTAGLRAGLH